MASMVIQTSSTSTPPPPPLNHPIKYDVFLSFRGADTRTKFTDHLYNALHVQEGIPTFRDSEELEKGEDLSQLFEAIEKSKIAVVILSSNYASSTWCLREVAKIAECRNKTGLIALPVFYEIEPTQVRSQTGSFKKYFDEHEQKYKDSTEKVDIWRKALTEIGGLSGWDLKEVRSETTVIKEIVKCVDTKWKLKFNPAFSIEDSKDFVGMDHTIQIELDLDIEMLDKIVVIGIWGVPGVGKTTIAEVVFRRNWHHFEANSFLANVGEIHEEKGLLHIQKQLYRDLLDSKVITMKDVTAARRKLRHKKVLIILDGVTELDTVVELVGIGGKELNEWFGLGSRIIITTIDKKLLEDFEAKTHEVETLSENESRVLFFRKAFKKGHPLHDCTELDFKFKIDHTMRQYVELSYKFVDLTDGLPLAIVVLGRLLLNRSLAQWDAELRTLEANHVSNDKKSFAILKLCIDGLRDRGKEIFLDIACFFKGDDKKRVERIFESCGHNPGIELDILVEKSVVTIVGGKLWMHDLLQEAGQKMVIQESKRLWKRSRLWDHEEAISVLKHDKGTSAVKGIFLSSPQLCKVRLKADSFSKMDFLRLLKIKNVKFSGCHEYDLSNKLSFLEWHDFPSTFLPSEFEPKNLVELHLPRSQVEQLWEDNITPPLEKLVVMDLSNCKELTTTPDFQSVPNLESLVLKGCTRLSEVDLTNGDQLQKLISLNLEGCESLSSLPNGICSLRSLTTFILSGCSRLANLPEKIGENMKQLSGLDLEGTAIKGLPTSIKHLTGLIQLNLKDCKNLLSLPAVICSLTKLQVLNLSGCSNLAELPENLGSLVGLKELDASRSCIRQVPSSILLLKDLESLSFCGCAGLQPSACPIGLQLPASFSGLDSLTKLDLSYCKLSDGAIPADLHCLSSLNHLSLSGNSLVSVPESITKLSKLEVLLLNDCSELRSLPDLPSSIRRVFARNCPLLRTYSNKLTVWSSTATGFCFINSQSSEERKLQRIPISEQHLLRPHLQKFYEDIIYKGCGFEYITPHTEIPSWFGHPGTGSSVTLKLPLDYFDGKRELMRLALCFVYEAQEHENMESTASNISAQEVKYSCNYSCRLSTYGGPHDDCPLLVCKLMDHDYVGSFRHWVYIAGGLFAERLIKRSVRAEVIINRPRVKVKACRASLIYSGGVTEFVWNLNLRDEIHMRNLSSGDQKEKSDDEFNKQEQETICDHQLELKHVPVQYQAQMNRMISLYDTKRSYKQSLDHDAGSSSRTSSSTEEPHQRLEIPKSNDQSNKQDQETNYGCATDKRFLIEIEPHNSRDSSTSTTIFDDQLRTNVEPFLEELFELGGKARRNDLGFIFPLRAILPWFNHQCIGNVFIPEKERIGSSVSLPLPLELYNNKEWVGFAVYVAFTLPPGVSLEKSCCFKSVLYTSDGHFYCLKLSAACEDNFRGAHRLLVIHIPRGRFKKQLNECVGIRAAFVSSTPSVEAEMCGIRVVYEQDLKGLIQTITQCTTRNPPAVYYGLAHSFVPDGRDSFMLAIMEDNLIEAAKSSKRKLSTLQEPLTDSKFLSGQQIYLEIEAGTPYMPHKFKNSIVDWKKNLELLLECFFTLSDLSINLTLHRSTTSFSRDFDPCSGIFLQREIPEWFTRQYPSESMVLELPPNLENDLNFNGLVVCAAFSVHASEADVLKYLKSGLHPQLTCHFQNLSSESSDQSYGLTAPMIDTSPENKFMWLYRRGFIWQEYLPRDLFKDLLHKDSSVKVSFRSDSSQVLEVQKCSFRILYKQDVEKFQQMLIECFASFFDNYDIIRAYLVQDSGDYSHLNHHAVTPFCQGETSGKANDQLELGHVPVQYQPQMDSMISLYDTKGSNMQSLDHDAGSSSRTGSSTEEPLQILERPESNDRSDEQVHGTNSDLTHVAECGYASDTIFLIEIEPHTSRDNSSSTKIVGGQLRTNVESFLEELFELGGKARRYDLGFIFSLRAILPWFKHQGIGDVIGVPLPLELYNNKECIGFSLYVIFTLPPGAWLKEGSCFKIEFTEEPRYCLNLASAGEDNFRGSHRLLVIHIPQRHFGEQLNQWSTIRASFESLMPGVEVEMCGMRVVYQENLKGLIQTITNCTICSPPAYYGLAQPFVPGRWSYVFTHMRNSLVEAAKSSKRKLSTLQEPLTDLKSIQGIQLLILAATPFTSLKKTETVIKWKRNLKLLLQRFLTLSGLSISLILRGGRISFSEDHNLHTGIFFQKEIPDWFTPHHSASMVPELPPDLENDMNLMGFVVCAAFSVHASKADVLKYLDSGHHPELMCHFQSSSDYSGVVVRNMVGISPKNKFMWFYRRGFIWLHYVPRHNVEHLFNKLSELEVSFESDSPQVLAVQKCSFRFLYKQDVEGFNQTIIECFTSFFDNGDIIKPYIEEEDSGHNKWPNHGDEMGPSSTTGGNIVIEQTHNERLDVPITDGKGKGPSDVSSVEADERDYYGTTAVCQGETSGQAASHQLELVTHVVEEEHGSSTSPQQLIPFLSEIEPPASTGSSSTRFEGDQFRASGKCSDQLELVTHVVEEEHGSSCPPELIPFLFEIEPSVPTDSSPTKFEGDQFRTNVETLLAVMFRDKIKGYDFEHGFILSPRVGAILPWFNHQTIGSEALVLHLPPDLYNDKKWAGLALYVAFTVPPGYTENILCRCSLSTSAGHAEAITIACSQGNFSGSRRLCFIHKPRARFPEQWNTCSYISAFFEVLTPVVDVEMCGIHLLYEQDLIGIIQTITHCTIRSPPVYYGIGFANTPRQSQMGQPFADINMDTNLNELAARTPSTAQEPVKTLVGQVIHLRIHGDTPFKKKYSVMEWKKNLQFLLQCFFRFPLSITLTLGGDVISSLGDSDPYCLCSSSIIPQKDIPKWFCGVKYHTNKLKTTLPPNLENDENWLGFVVCAAFSVHASQADVLSYLDSENYPKLTCLLQWGSERALNLKAGKKSSIVLKNEFMWLYLRRFIWLRYIPHQKFKDRLHISDHLEASFRTDSISSKVLRIQECSLRVLYKKDVEEFKQTIIECFTCFFDNEDVIRPYIGEDSRHNKWPSHADDRDSYGTTPVCQGERGSASSTSPELMPFFIETEPPASTDSSSTKVTRQLRMIESSLEQLFQGGSARHYNYGFILSPRVRAVLPWFSHQSIGNEVKINAPPDLYKDNKWVGFALYVAFTQSPGSHSCSMCSLSVFPGHSVHSINTCLGEDQFSGSRRLCFFHIPRARFPEQCDQCPVIFARFDFFSPGSEVEMCGIRVVYDEDIKGLVQTITQSTIRSPPPFYFSQDEKTEIFSPGRLLLPVHMALSLVAYSKACILPTRSARSPLVPSMKFGKVNLVIHGDTQFRKDTTEWKRNFEILLQSFFRLDLSVKLVLGEDTIAFYQDCFNHACLFPQKKIPDWFKEKSLTSTYVYPLPDDLESDNNWMGLVVCAAFSVHPLPTDLGNYKDSELSSDVKCNFRWSSNPYRFISINEGVLGVRPNNKFMWLSRRGFIWLQFISGEIFRFAMDKHRRQLEASFESGSPALSVQECSYRILYKQDLQEYKQTIIQCFASVFDNLDHSLPYKEDDSRHNEEPIHEDDQMDSLGTTSFSEDTPHGRETTVALPESETSGNSFNRFNSILFEPILYDNKTAVIFADFRGWEE
ncbi:uncharacterized protein LOC112195031 isoform X2 [Rosa chinensis]|nr:uncharacterized protein LOC112195031 isoform X2 [Rosa chinensis]